MRTRRVQAGLLNTPESRERGIRLDRAANNTRYRNGYIDTGERLNGWGGGTPIFRDLTSGRRFTVQGDREVAYRGTRGTSSTEDILARQRQRGVFDATDTSGNSGSRVATSRGGSANDAQRSSTYMGLNKG